MAIYYGNLDRELADRQNVLKEDAARQYRGYRDIQQSFGSLGDTVSSSIKDVAQAKLDQAKLQYNISRNEEADKIRAEQHSQATQRNRELSLDSTLKNIERFRKSSVENYIGKLWNWSDPKAVHASYAERMKVFTADKDTLDPDLRIQMYPNLFGTKAVEKLKIYKDLLALKKKGVTVSDKDIQVALNDLPLVPLNFMDWAIDTKRYNEKVKGINPTKIPNAMQRAALIEAGYDIPDPEKLFKEASATTAGLKEPPPARSEVTVKEELEIDSLTSKPGAEKEAEQKVEELGIDSGVGGVVTVGGTKYSLGGGGVVGDSSTVTTDGETVDKLGQGHYEDGIWVSATGDKMSLEGDEIGEQKHKSNQNNSPGWPGRKTLDGQELSQEAQNAIEQVTTVDEDALRYQKYHRKMKESPGYPGRANSFKVAAEIVGPSVTNTITSSIYGGNRIQEAANQMNREAKIIDTPEYREQRASKNREELTALRGAIDYKDLPAYKDTDSWITLSPEGKSKLLKHPAVQVQGASPEKVFNFEKAKEELSDKDHEIFMLHNPLKHYSVLKDPGSDFNKLVIPTSKYDGKVGTNVELASRVERYNRTMPLLTEERKKLLTKFNKAERSMDASKTKNIDTGATYLGERPASITAPAFPFGEAKDYGIRKATIKPRNTSSYEEGGGVFQNIISEQPSDDEGYEAAVRANYAADTQEEIISGIIEREGYGYPGSSETEGAGYSYYDGTNPDKRGYYKKDGGETLTLAGGNNIYGTINGMSGNERKEAIKEITDGLFGEGNSGERPYITKQELLKFLNMPKKNHKKEYDTIVKRGKLRLKRHQMKFLTGFSYRNHLERMIKHHPYLSDIGQFPKEMQVFLMDNAFNMGPRWLKDKFIKTEEHLRRWVKTRLPSDLEKMKEEYKNSDHYRDTTRAKDLVAMI